MKKIFRRMHLWLSVPFGLLITLICFSGAMLVFEKEIMETSAPQRYYVEQIGEKALPIDELMEKVAGVLPDSVQVTGITVFPNPERTWLVYRQLRRMGIPAELHLYPDKGSSKWYTDYLY